MNGKILTLWKRLLSYRKKDWDFGDYPVRYKKQPGNDSIGNKSEFKEWAAQIVNWPLIGLGDTKAEAFGVLRDAFHTYKKSGEKLSRPGVPAPIRFAETTEIERLEVFAADFFAKILEYDFYDCFISDDSSVFDFNVEEKEILEKINAAYQLLWVELGDGNIVRLLQAIKARNIHSAL